MGPLKKTIAAAVLVFLPAYCEVHDVPGRKQDKPDNCGPTAVTACLGWFKNHGYDLKTRDGKTDLDDIQKQIDKDSRSSDREKADHEREVDELEHALKRLLKGGPYEKRLKPGRPEPGDLKGYKYLDTEFSHGEDIILLLRFGNNQGHYVTVRNITPNKSGGRTIEYMDPADGMVHMVDVQADGGKLRLVYDGKKGYIENALTLSPTNTTESSDPTNADPANPGAGKKVIYKPYFPQYAVPKDLHILVSDCDLKNYSVTGLPEGWTVSIQRIAGKCYLTVNKGEAKADLDSGKDIDVVYKGAKMFSRREHAVIQTADGGVKMTSPLTDEPGEAIADRDVRPPDQVRGFVCSLGEQATEGRYAANLKWTTVPGAAGYVVRETHSGAVMGRSAGPAITLQLMPDTLYSLTVAAEVDDSSVIGPESEPIVVHRDDDLTMIAAAGDTQTLEYVSPLTSWHYPYSWTFTVPGADRETRIDVTTIVGAMDPPVPTRVGDAQARWYYLTATTPLRSGPVTIEIPYADETDHPRLYTLANGAWTDVTLKVDADRRMISGKLAGLGAVAIVDAPKAAQGFALWGVSVVVALIIILLLAFRMRRATRKASEIRSRREK
jgi:hypothetical protein